MSYPMDLDEYQEERILTELIHRYKRQVESKCDYCNRTQDTKSCKEYGRHKKETNPVVARVKLRLIKMIERML